MKRFGFLRGQISVPDDFDTMFAERDRRDVLRRQVRLLLDTHFAPLDSGPMSGLSSQARRLIGDPENELLFSVASVWEVAIKYGRARDDFQVDPRLLRRALLDNGYRELRSPASTPWRSPICRRCTATRSTASWSPRASSKALRC